MFKYIFAEHSYSNVCIYWSHHSSRHIFVHGGLPNIDEILAHKGLSSGIAEDRGYFSFFLGRKQFPASTHLMNNCGVECAGPPSPVVGSNL